MAAEAEIGGLEEGNAVERQDDSMPLWTDRQIQTRHSAASSQA